MICRICGASIDGSYKFCPVCGNKLDKNNPFNDINTISDNDDSNISYYEGSSDNDNKENTGYNTDPLYYGLNSSEDSLSETLIVNKQNNTIDKKLQNDMGGDGPNDEYYSNIPNGYINPRISKRPNYGENGNKNYRGNYELFIDDNSDYDESPNNHMEEANDGEKKIKYIYLIPAILLIFGIVFAYLWMNRAPETVEIDLSEYIDVAFDGDDGSATPSASLNSSKLLADYGGQIAYTNKKRKDDQYSSPANQFISELETNTDFNFSKEGNLSNGEEVSVVANIADSTLLNDYNVLFTNTIKSVIVDNLITQEYVDPFNYINVNYDGESPNISLTTTITEDAPPYMELIEIAPSKTSELSIGEELNISLVFDENEILNQYGIKFNPTDKMYTVPGETEAQETNDENVDSANTASVDGYIQTVDSLDEELLGTLKYNAGQLIKDTFEQRSFTQIANIDYLGALTGSDTNSNDLKNRVMLIYEIKTNEDYEGKYTNEFTYYTFVEYQNVMDSKNENGEFYTQGPMTTDNEIFHKFFVEDDYTYYEIPYYGFGFLEEVLARVNNSLSGLTIENSIAKDQNSYFVTSDGLAGEYQGSGTRLTLREDGSLRYKLDQRIHQGKWQQDGNNVSLTIEGVNVDTPINATFENGAINVPEQGEVKGQTFNKMQAM